MFFEALKFTTQAFAGQGRLGWPLFWVRKK
jgi:hypothetical protein